MGPVLGERRQVTAPVQPQRERPRAERVRDRRLTTAGVLEMQRGHGNQAVQRMVRATKPVIARDAVVVQAGYMSGDMFGICAALTLDPTLRVLILEEGDEKFKGVREEQSALYEAFYTTALKQAGVKDDDIPKRIGRVKVNDTNNVYKFFTAGNYRRPYTGPKWADLQFKDHTPEKAGYATTIVGNTYQADSATSQDTVRKAFTGDKKGPNDDQLKEFVARKGFQAGKKYALLWIRLSAKEKSGGAHAELDTSIEGVRQLKKMLKSTGRTPVVIGDRPRKDVTAGAIDMIKFWDEEPFKSFKGLDTRIAQLRMFEYMRGAGIDLISIGMRSGAMEGPALLGIPTIYIEEVGNQQAGRMQKWKGKVPGWQQVQVDTLPTRTGKRYQKQGAVLVPTMEKQVTDAINGVVSATGNDWTAVVGVLYPNYADAEATFVANVKLHLKLERDLKPAVSDAMKVWHGAYKQHRVVLNKLVGAEAIVARETGKDPGVVATALREGGADNINTGLADYMRIVLPKLRPPKTVLAAEAGEGETKEAEQRDAARLAAVTDAIRKWRAIWVGKESLGKGFEGKDLDTLVRRTALGGEKLAHIRSTKATLLTEIDTLSGEKAGTCSGRLDKLSRATPEQFVKGYLVSCAYPLKTKLGLRGPSESRESVQAKAISYGQTVRGKTWWTSFDAKLRELHTALFPDMS
jgi:hypothetical protein